MSQKKLVMLAIMDGFGIREDNYGNAIATAKTPNLDYLMKEYPNTTIEASGEAVGLPAGQFGNSEVGHMNLGAGRVVFQSLTRLNIAVREQTLEKMDAIATAFKHAKENNSSLHIMGLLSPGGVHSHMDHIIYLMNKANDYGIKNVYVHSFLDGRDVPPRSAKEYLEAVDQARKENVHMGVVTGRYYAMDRDKNYDRTQIAYNALVYSDAPVKPLIQGLEDSYNDNVSDEFVKPYIVTEGSNIKEGDSVIFANFRPDRAIQISMALTNPTETTMTKYEEFKDLCYVSMMLYSDKVRGLVNFGVQELNDLYGDVISKNGLRQLRIAETEKYAHVTFFFDGGVDKQIEGADRILVDSPKVATFDLQPEMSAYKVTEKVVEAIKTNNYDTIILNFANCDMVGHTAVWDAVVKAVEVVDECMGEVYKAVKSVEGTLIIIADHGNADQVYDENNNLVSAHTTSPVPFIITRKDVELRETGNLGDVAPTMLQLLDIPQPAAMTGTSMIKKMLK